MGLPTGNLLDPEILKVNDLGFRGLGVNGLRFRVVVDWVLLGILGLGFRV